MQYINKIVIGKFGRHWENGSTSAIHFSKLQEKNNHELKSHTYKVIIVTIKSYVPEIGKMPKLQKEDTNSNKKKQRNNSCNKKQKKMRA